MPSTGEWLLILFVGILVFGRDLPDVGRRLGRTIANLRKGLDDFKREMGKDPAMRDARSSLGEIGRTIDQTKRLVDPRRVIDDLTRLPPEDERPADHDAIDESPDLAGPPAEEARRSVPPSTPSI